MNKMLRYLFLFVLLTLAVAYYGGGAVRRTDLRKTLQSSVGASGTFPKLSLYRENAEEPSGEKDSTEKNDQPSSMTQTATLKFLSTTRRIKKLVGTTSLADASKAIGVSADKLTSIITRATFIERTILQSQLTGVHNLAAQFKDSLDTVGLTHSDLVDEGLRGVQSAIFQFDPTKGTSFGAFATTLAKSYMKNAVSSAQLVSPSKKVRNLVQQVQSTQQRLAGRLGRIPNDDELAAEMGISMERYEIVRRAIAVAEHYGDKSPFLTEDRRSNAPVHFDESTWERVVESDLEGSAVQHVASTQPVPQVRAVASSNTPSVDEVKDVFRALNTLPKEEARAVYKKLGVIPDNEDSDSDDNTDADDGKENNGAAVQAQASGSSSSSGASENIVSKEKEDDKLFDQAINRLRSRILDPKYPEIQRLINILAEARRADIMISLEDGSAP